MNDERKGRKRDEKESNKRRKTDDMIMIPISISHLIIP